MDAAASVTVLDAARGFGGNTVQPQAQWLFAGSAAMPVLAMAQWAARGQAEDQVGVANLDVADVRRQVGVAAAEAYLLILSAKRQQEVNERARDTALAQLGSTCPPRRRRRQPAERAARRAGARGERGTRRAFSAGGGAGPGGAGLVMAADGPMDAVEEPAFETPGEVAESWVLDRTDIKLFDTRIDAAGRVVADSWKDWVPQVRASFDPQYITPSGLFQPAGTWRAVVAAAIPIWDSGQRGSAVRAAREADLLQTRVDRREGELRARAGVRAARVTIDAEARALEKAREASTQAAEVLRITDIAFRAGSTTNIELVDAQRSSRDAETAVRQAEDRARFARLALLVALGRFPN